MWIVHNKKMKFEEDENSIIFRGFFFFAKSKTITKWSFFWKTSIENINEQWENKIDKWFPFLNKAEMEDS